jgi:peptide/nickel transport system substrate-binding protein
MRDASPPRRRPGPMSALALLLALALVAAACGGDDDGGATGDPSAPVTTAPPSGVPDVGDVTPGGTLIVGLEAEQNNWLPGRGNFGNPGTAAARAVYDPIAIRGEDGNVYPYLAESIEPNDDLTEWTITLRPGIEMHDGTPLTAELMKRIFDEYLDIEGVVGLPTLINEVTEIRVDDELTYTYLLAQGIAAFPDILAGPAGWPFSIDACEAAGGRDGDCGEQMVGTGPFMFVSWTRDSELRLERNPDYWRVDADGNQLPYLDELIFRPIPDEDARLNSVASGTIQMGQTLRQSSVLTARSLSGVDSYEAIGNNAGSAIMNTAVPPVDDVRVRRALAHALDQEALITVLGGQDITPAQTQFFSPDSPWFSEAVADAWPSYDPERAAELIEEYANDPNRSDGNAVGTPVAIEFNCPPDPTLLDLAQAYQAFWQDIGIDVSLNSVEQATHITNAVSGEYMMNCWRLGGQEDPYVTLSSQFGDPTAPSNVTNYSSERLTENLATLRTSTDFDERYAAVEDIGFELAENVPNTWTAGTATAMYVVDSVQNVDGWTIPDPDGAPLVRGTGVVGAVIFWAEIWMER